MGGARGLVEEVLGLPPTDAAFGSQRSSLRASSARYSFPRSSRSCEDAGAGPGPALYDVGSAADKHIPSATFGLAARDLDGVEAHQNDFVGQEPSQEYQFDSRYLRSARAVFDKAPRDAMAADLEYLRASPDHAYLREGPGFIYNPDGTKASGRRTPGYTMPRASSRRSSSVSSTPAGVAPGVYGTAEQAFGPQCNSRRSSARASSFGRAARFAGPKQASGGVNEESRTPLRSSFAPPSRVSKHKKAPSASFGTASRGLGSAAGFPDKSSVAAKLGPAKMPHPVLPTRHEALRYDSDMVRRP
mmetsp:Transcript_58063/g.138149  ORF Transcript_58063/g.138149 Transcript_58063/m.138149 type:complete len:302 (+) Transcript_58063:111-1016(+)